MKFTVFSLLVVTAVAAQADVPVLRQGILSQANRDSNLEFEIYPDRHRRTCCTCCRNH